MSSALLVRENFSDLVLNLTPNGFAIQRKCQTRRVVRSGVRWPRYVGAILITVSCLGVSAGCGRAASPAAQVTDIQTYVNF